MAPQPPQHGRFLQAKGNMWAVYGFIASKAQRGHSVVMAGGAKVEIAPGQVLTCRRELCEATGLSEKAVRVSVERLALLGLASVHSTNQYTIVTLKNWQLPPEC